jgi:DNA polymerase III alpha subunit
MPIPYIELHAHSAFSFLDGASAPEELAEAAAAFGYQAMALTDHDGLCGSLAFAHAARDAGVRPITGCEITLADQSHLTLLAASATGYANLCRLITSAHARTRETRDRRAGMPTLDPELLGSLADGLICLTGCARQGLIPRLVATGQNQRATAWMTRLVEWFGPGCVYIELQYAAAARCFAVYASLRTAPEYPLSQPATCMPTTPTALFCRTHLWRLGTARPSTDPSRHDAEIVPLSCGRPTRWLQSLPRSPSP